MMSIRSWLFGHRPTEPNFVVVQPAAEETPMPTTEETPMPAEAPLHKEVQNAQRDFVQTIVALGRANAEARSVLARQTLLNVQGTSDYAAHR